MYWGDQKLTIEHVHLDCRSADQFVNTPVKTNRFDWASGQVSDLLNPAVGKESLESTIFNVPLSNTGHEITFGLLDGIEDSCRASWDPDRGDRQAVRGITRSGKHRTNND